MAGGVDDALDQVQEVAEHAAPAAVEFGRHLLVWLEDPMHWFPAILIVVALGVWRGSITFARGRRSDASIVRLARREKPRPPDEE